MARAPCGRGPDHPGDVRRDPSLRELVTVVPFGLDPQPPARRAHAIKGVVPGIGPEDPVVLWGGGVYNWFDPLTVRRRRRSGAGVLGVSVTTVTTVTTAAAARGEQRDGEQSGAGREHATTGRAGRRCEVHPPIVPCRGAGAPRPRPALVTLRE
ncbi:hypothetical protein [Georgenia sp. SUBG003]|uniref:hypothetical protein n=1 Tax=Georgenia sp. SUBG003 TaxID=1497974 RepID=UPI003AB10CDA